MIRKEYKKGQEVGKLGVLFFEEAEPDKPNRAGQRQRNAVFICPCGNRFTANIQNVKGGRTRSCGCVNERNVPRELYVISDKKTRRIYVGLTHSMEARDHSRDRKEIAELRDVGVYKRLHRHLPEKEAAALEAKWIERLHNNPHWTCINNKGASGQLGGSREISIEEHFEYAKSCECISELSQLSRSKLRGAGLLEQACSHMRFGTKKRPLHLPEEVIADALKHPQQQQWVESSDLYYYARRNGLLDICTRHMASFSDEWNHGAEQLINTALEAESLGLCTAKQIGDQVYNTWSDKEWRRVINCKKWYLSRKEYIKKVNSCNSKKRYKKS